MTEYRHADGTVERVVPGGIRHRELQQRHPETVEPQPAPETEDPEQTDPDRED